MISVLLALVVQVSWSTAVPVALAQGQSGQAAVAARQNVVAVVPHSWPPQYDHDEEGKAAGFAIDVMNEIAARVGITATYKVAKNFSEAVEILNRGEANLNGRIPAKVMSTTITSPPTERAA